MRRQSGVRIVPNTCDCRKFLARNAKMPIDSTLPASSFTTFLKSKSNTVQTKWAGDPVPTSLQSANVRASFISKFVAPSKTVLQTPTFNTGLPPNTRNRFAPD